MPPMTGRVIAGRYSLQTPIGRGAMGVVWRAHDQLLDREVAVKEVVISAMIGEEERYQACQRTLREARTAARLSHRGVVTVYDVAEEDGRPWIIMELVPSQSLDQVLAVQRRLSPLRAARIGQQLLAALAHAHSCGVLHRDVKPSNVLIARERSSGSDDWDQRAVLTDFGIAQFEGDPRLTATGMVMGSPGFTAPERIRGGEAAPASDLWSLGATIYTAVEGRGPYEQRGGAITTMSAIIHEDAPIAPHAGQLGPLIAALLRRNPSERPTAPVAARMIARVLPLLAETAAARTPSSHPPTVRSAAIPPRADSRVSAETPGRGPSAAGRPATVLASTEAAADAPGPDPDGDVDADADAGQPTVIDDASAEAAAAAAEAPAETPAETPAEAAAETGDPAAESAGAVRADAGGSAATVPGESAEAAQAAEPAESAEAAESAEVTMAGDPVGAVEAAEVAEARESEEPGDGTDAVEASVAEADPPGTDPPGSDSSGTDPSGNEASDVEAASQRAVAAAEEHPAAMKAGDAGVAATSVEPVVPADAVPPAGEPETAVDPPAAEYRRGGLSSPAAAGQPKPTFTASRPGERVTPTFSAARPDQRGSNQRGSDGRGSDGRGSEYARQRAGAAQFSGASAQRGSRPGGTAPLASPGSQYAGPSQPYADLSAQYPPGTGGGRARRHGGAGRWIAVAAVVLLLAAGIGFGVAYMLRGHHGTYALRGDRATQAGDSLTRYLSVNALNRPNATVRAGWSCKRVTASDAGSKAGFSVCLPPGWSEARDNARTDFLGPGNLFLEVDLTQHTYPNMLKEGRYIERQSLAAHKFARYRRRHLQPVPVRGTKGAIWQFDWKPAGSPRLLADDILFIKPTPAGSQSYAIFIRGAKHGWGSTELPLFDKILHSFKTVPTS